METTLQQNAQRQPVAATPNKNTKVTLTNWKRLPNVPANVDLCGFVQPGVHWREYLVFLSWPNDSRPQNKRLYLYLYHLKMGMWSVMLSKNDIDPAKGCPLTVFDSDQDLILVSSSGRILKYAVENLQWMEFGELSGYDHNSGCTLDSVVLASTADLPQSLFLLWQGSKEEVNESTGRYFKRNHLYVFKFQNSKWTEPVELVDDVFLRQGVAHLSYAISRSNLYVNIDGSVIYCINAQNVVSKIPLPSLTKTTICSVKDTMFSFGGQDDDQQPSSDVNRYNPHTKEWEPAGYMRSCRYSVTAVPLFRENDNVDIFIIGGDLGQTKEFLGFDNSVHCRIAEVCEVGVTLSPVPI